MSFRTGKDFEFDPINGTNIMAREIGFKETTFYNSTLNGTHKIDALGGFTVNWYGSFGILDQYIPYYSVYSTINIQYQRKPLFSFDF
jgi:hypothetical protein